MRCWEATQGSGEVLDRMMESVRNESVRLKFWQEMNAIQTIETEAREKESWTMGQRMDASRDWQSKKYLYY